jgi:acyl dehydratase
VTRRREVAAALLAGAVAIALWVLAASRPSLWPSGCEDYSRSTVPVRPGDRATAEEHSGRRGSVMRRALVQTG